jgi:hypothetical protein
VVMRGSILGTANPTAVSIKADGSSALPRTTP